MIPVQGIGCTKITKAKNEGSMNENVETISYLEKRLVFCFGSHVASQLLLPFGEENLLSVSELKQAQEVGLMSALDMLDCVFELINLTVTLNTGLHSFAICNR